MAWADQFEVLAASADDVGPVAVIGDCPPQAAVSGFPQLHKDLLERLNGFTVYGGAFRLFGLRSELWADIDTWNRPETWRFAWDDRVSDFLMFGETAWGDQYAYRRSESGRLGEEVYFLEATMLRNEIIANSFDEFLSNELARNSADPYDDHTHRCGCEIRTRRFQGPLGICTFDCVGRSGESRQRGQAPGSHVDDLRRGPGYRTTGAQGPFLRRRC